MFIFWVVLAFIVIVIYSDKKADKARQQGHDEGFNAAGIYYERELRRVGAPDKVIQYLRDSTPPKLPELPPDIVITHKSNLKGQRSLPKAPNA